MHYAGNFIRSPSFSTQQSARDMRVDYGSPFSSVFEVCLSVNPARRSAARAARIAQMPTAIPDPQAATAYNRYATLNEWQILGADIAHA